MKDYHRRVAPISQIKFNQGRALLHLAGMYPTLQEVVLELVQNALDKDVNATRIWITINYKNRYLAVRDNGAGSSVERFIAALSSVAEPGRKGEGSLGQFGIGLISPLGKCERFKFTSCPAPHKVLYHEWTFDTERIINQKENLSIPSQPRNDFVFEDKMPGKTTREWRSEMALMNFTADNFISRVPIDTLIGGIQDRYATVMRRNKVKISVRITQPDGKEERRDDVTAAEFRGRKLAEQELVDANMGKVLFRMFISPKTKKGRKGRVLMGVMGNDFRFEFQYFARSAAELIREEVVTALASGLFEGEILAEKARLHPSRKTFEKDDFYIGLCVAIEEWFDKYGKHHMEEARQSRQEERFQELGLRSMKVLEHLLTDPVHTPLMDVIKSFARGTVGIGHADVPTSKVFGQQEEKTLSAAGNPGNPQQGDEENPPRVRKPSQEHRPSHTPLTVTGPKGERRKVVRGHSMGLGFSYDGMEGSPDLWKLDTQIGVLHFNIRHPLWIACDEKSDLALMKLQEYVAIQALTLQIMPANSRDCQRRCLDELTQSLVSWILRGDRARGSIPSSKKKSSVNAEDE